MALRVELDESDALTSQSKGEARKVKAQRSQDLQLLATRLELRWSVRSPHGGQS